MKSKRKSKKIKPGVTVTYTHTDKVGMPWRFAGGRPVSKVADEVMHHFGFPLPR